jgi:hypothetical protein
MIKCSCTSKRRRCIKKSRRKIISNVAHHPSVSVHRVAAAGAAPRLFAFAPPTFAVPPIVDGHQYVADHRCVGMYLLEFASLNLEGVGTAPDIFPGLNDAAADIASTKEQQDDEEPAHSFAGPGLVRRLWPFDNVHRSCCLESDA